LYSKVPALGTRSDAEVNKSKKTGINLELKSLESPGLTQRIISHLIMSVGSARFA
jgi:hypothetical protein